MEDNCSTQNVNEHLQSTTIKKPSLTQISILYSISMLLLVLLGSRAQKNELYSGILITEFILILLPPLAVLFLYRYDTPNVLRLNKISFKNILLIFWIMIFAIPVVGILNLVNYWLLQYIFGKVVIQQPPIPTSITGLIISVLIIGGSAGICEEIMFRGVIMRGFERFGALKSILFTALLFGLMHVDFEKLMGTFLLGALIGFIVYRTNSLFGGMFAHFTNNSIAVIAVYGANKLKDVSAGNSTQTQQLDFSSLGSLPQAQLIAVIIIWSILALICISTFIQLMIKFIRSTSMCVEGVPNDTISTSKSGLLWLLPGVVIVGFIYIAQGLKLKGISIHVIDTILKFVGLK